MTTSSKTNKSRIVQLPDKICPVCGKTFNRNRFNNRLEDLTRYSTRTTCSQSCGNTRSEPIDELKGTKRCRICKQEKPLDEFYFHRLGNRYRSDCKKCYIISSNNWNYKNKIKLLHNIRVYRSTLKGKVATNKNSKNMYKKYPEKWNARFKLNYAVKTGKIAKFACEKCGNFLSEAHHTDYSKALDVIWLCHKHHMSMHRGFIKQ